MIEIVWEFITKESCHAQFELAYGPGGAWSTLFAQRPGFRGATVLRDTKEPRRFLTVEHWDSEAQREQALIELANEYADLWASLDDLIESKTEMGVFRVRAEATVRPRGKGYQSNRRTPR